MKSRIFSATAAAALAAGLILAPGLSPASASTGDDAAAFSQPISAPGSDGAVATPMGVGFFGCSFAGLRWC